MEKYVLNTAEKIDVIYELLQEWEARRRRNWLFRMLKWTIIFAVVFLTITQPQLVINKITSYLQPIVMEQMKSVIDGQKESMMKQAKELMQDSVK
jgi:hypothetical protein